ncbi:hypothetical protein GCM10027589_08950 [Actinocorallia lasiicapitis]
MIRPEASADPWAAPHPWNNKFATCATWERDLINTNRERIRLDLLSYGEDRLAVLAADLTDGDLHRIGERATELTFSTAQGRIYLALALAAVEVMEGDARPLKFSRRRIKGIWDTHSHA